MANFNSNSLHHHLVAIKDGHRRFENAFQGVARMILESDIEKVVVNGKTTYDFSIFRNGKKHLIGLYDEINSFVSYVKDAAEGGSSKEMAFARVNSGVTFMPRVGLNPYALGMRLFYYMEDLANKGRYSIQFQRMQDMDARKNFDQKAGQGRDFIFKIRSNYCDFMLINDFVDQDFMDQHKLFVAGKRLNQNKMVLEYYVKSRKARDYRQMLMDSLYHPPAIVIDKEKSSERTLYLTHHFEGKPLVKDFIPNTLLGIEYLWGGPIKLETSEVVPQPAASRQTYHPGPMPQPTAEETKEVEIKWQRVLYTMEDRKWSKTVL